MTPYKVVGVRLALAADSIPGYNDIDAVVIGRITTPGIFSSVLWSTGATSDTIIINAPGGYKVTAIDANGCMAMDSVTSIMPTVVTPSIIARGPTSFCPGDSVWLVSNQHGHQLWSNGATTDSIAVKIVGNYSVVYDDGSGCGTTMSNVIAVTIFTPPVVNITGDTVICQDCLLRLMRVLTLLISGLRELPPGQPLCSMQTPIMFKSQTSMDVNQ
ncbi:MAG: hypothetical protein IPP42_01635 [Saprospiraceae bacterium]|nr:hypothetical protein [Saprospiraceae bacterium]